MKYFEIIMSLLYLFAGVILVAAPRESFNFPSTYTIPLGIVLVVYGLVRAYRVYKKYFSDRYESENPN